MIKKKLMLKKTEKDVFNFFSQTKIDISPLTEVSAKQNLSPSHEHFGSPENVMNYPATHNSSLDFDAGDKFYSVKNDILHVSYAQTDYLSSYTATPPRQDPHLSLFTVFTSCLVFFTKKSCFAKASDSKN